jgi:hypothetical protein
MLGKRVRKRRNRSVVWQFALITGGILLLAAILVFAVRMATQPVRGDDAPFATGEGIIIITEPIVTEVQQGVPVPLHEVLADPAPVQPRDGIAYDPDAAFLIPPGKSAEVLPGLTISVDQRVPVPVWINGGAIAEVITIHGGLTKDIEVMVLPWGTRMDVTDQPDGSLRGGVELEQPLFLGASLLATVLMATDAGQDQASAVYNAAVDNYALACAPDVIYEAVVARMSDPQYMPATGVYAERRNRLCGREYAASGVRPDGWTYDPRAEPPILIVQ